MIKIKEFDEDYAAMGNEGEDAYGYADLGQLSINNFVNSVTEIERLSPDKFSASPPTEIAVEFEVNAIGSTEGHEYTRWGTGTTAAACDPRRPNPMLTASNNDSPL